jgi:hypothetical protein
MRIGIAADGVCLGSNYTVNMYLARCRDVPPHAAVKADLVKLLLLVPGPRDPTQGLVQHTSLILELLIALGPTSGMPKLLVPLYMVRFD